MNIQDSPDTFAIDNFDLRDDIPLPRRQQPTSKYPWATMKVGQSFVYAGRLAAAQASAVRYGKLLQRKFMARTYEGKSRIWRKD
jgi:hypothetical protein